MKWKFLNWHGSVPEMSHYSGVTHDILKGLVIIFDRFGVTLALISSLDSFTSDHHHS